MVSIQAMRCTIMNDYITVQQAAEKWKISPRQVQILCKNGRVPGAVKMSGIWIIPHEVEKPTQRSSKSRNHQNL